MLFVVAAIALLSSAACAQATPTVDPSQIQASAVAAANTMVALTQAAIPTDTQVPPSPLPSPTELPSPTPFALPTLDNSGFPTASVPTVSVGSTSDLCGGPMAAKPAGKKTPLHIINTNKGPAIVSLALSKTPFGECGIISVTIAKGGSADLTLPSGCYFPAAYVSKPDSTPWGPSFCIKGTLKLTLFIYKDNFKLAQ